MIKSMFLLKRFFSLGPHEFKKILNIDFSYLWRKTSPKSHFFSDFWALCPRTVSNYLTHLYADFNRKKIYEYATCQFCNDFLSNANLLKIGFSFLPHSWILFLREKTKQKTKHYNFLNGKKVQNNKCQVFFSLVNDNDRLLFETGVMC